MDAKDRIVQGSLRQFMQYGFRNVSMDDIASNLGMSKKTLYQHFTEKEELVAAALEFDIENNQKDCVRCTNTSNNAIAEVYDIIRVVAEQLRDMNPMVLFEMQKFHPKAFKRFQQHKDEFILKMIHQNSILLKNLKNIKFQYLKKKWKNFVYLKNLLYNHNKNFYQNY